MTKLGPDADLSPIPLKFLSFMNSKSQLMDNKIDVIINDELVSKYIILSKS